MFFEQNLSTIVSKGPLKKRFRAFPASTKVVQKAKSAVLVNPDSRRYQTWEFLVVLVTFYTTLVTPFEVSFLSSDIVIDGLFMMNLTIDLIFLTDTALTFFVPFYDPKTGLWCNNRKRIAYKYLTGRFLLDFIPSVPYDLISVVILLSTSSSAQIGALKTLRVLRVLKVLKIIRLIKLSNIYRKYHDRIPLRYTTIALIKFALIMLVFSHWLACVFRVVIEVETLIDSVYDGRNWLDSYFEGLGVDEDDYGVYAEYNAAFYWAVMTLTTVGYGDVSAVTDFERSIVSLFMLIGAILYAYIVGSICGIIASMRKKDAEFFERLDELDEYMVKENFPQFLRLKVRNYFFYAESKRVFDHYNHLVQSLTPSLREEISTFRNHQFLLGVPFVKCAPVNEVNQFVIALSVKLTLEVFPPFEVLMRKGTRINKFFIIKSGTVLLHNSPRVELDENDEPEQSVKRGNIFYRESLTTNLEVDDGSCFGMEIILEPTVYSSYFATALTYCELYQLSKEDFQDVLNNHAHSETAKNIRLYAKQFEGSMDTGTIDGLFTYATAQQQAEEQQEEPPTNTAETPTSSESTQNSDRDVAKT